MQTELAKKLLHLMKERCSRWNVKKHARVEEIAHSAFHAPHMTSAKAFGGWEIPVKWPRVVFLVFTSKTTRRRFAKAVSSAARPAFTEEGVCELGEEGPT